MISCGKLSGSIRERAAHTINAATLLVEVGVHVKVECGADVGMPEQDAHRLIVASAFDASGGKAVSEPVKLETWDIKLVDQRIVIRAIDARLCGFGVVGKHIEVGADYAVEWFEQATELIA